MPINYDLMITPEMKQAAALAAAVETYRKAIQSLIDGKAQEKQYDDGNSLASYVNSTVPEWAAEAQTFVAWRDHVWAYALAELAKVQKAEREQPSVDEFLAELPAFQWPAAA
jgi:collagenase-like PrtC family protease